MQNVIWEFDTAKFRVVLTVEDCPDDPEGMFADAEADAEIREGIESGRYVWFDATVTVYCQGVEIGSDTLCACCYNSLDEFISGHRDSNPLHRNCSIMRAVKGGNVVVGHYFPSMVACAIAEARKTLASMPRLRGRAA